MGDEDGESGNDPATDSLPSRNTGRGPLGWLHP